MTRSSPEQHWTASFARFEAGLDATQPAWLQARRKAALARFAELGFPTRRQEAWKYTNVTALAKLPFRPAALPAKAVDAAELARLPLPAHEAGRLVFVNGRLAPGHPGPGTREPRVELAGLAGRWAGDPGALEEYLTRLACFEEQPFVALNTAFLADGAYVRVPRDVELEQPVVLVFLTVPGSEPAATHPRVLVVAEPGSRATVLELYAGRGGAPYLTNAVTEVLVGENASVDHVKLQCEDLGAFHVGALHAAQARASRFRAHSLSFGAALARNDVTAVLDAEGAECALNGLYVTTEGQHVDHQTTIDHRKPHGTSRELYKGILSGASRGVFNGKIVVRPDAQKTDARQRNDNLLLSAGAEVDTKPQLEIHADDVKCSHGSTIGHLEEDALFYLRTRGIAEADARGILTRGFAGEVTRELRGDGLRAGVEAFLLAHLFGDRRGGDAA